MREAKYFTPNEEKHPAFAEALREAVKSGVKPLALTCRVSEDSINAEKFIEIRL
jgi:DNA-binding sugar fermentation-stimulating protein